MCDCGKRMKSAGTERVINALIVARKLGEEEKERISNPTKY